MAVRRWWTRPLKRCPEEEEDEDCEGYVVKPAAHGLSLSFCQHLFFYFFLTPTGHRHLTFDPLEPASA